MHGSCESVGSIRSTRRPRISAAHWKLEDLPSEISAEFVEEELNLKSNSQLQFEFPNYAFAIIKLCKIEMRSSLFFVNLKREHFARHTQLILNGIKIVSPVAPVLWLRANTYTESSSVGGGIRKREERGLKILIYSRRTRL